MGLRDWRDSEKKCPVCPTLLPCLRQLGKTLSYELSSPGCRQLDHRLQDGITQRREERGI